MRRHCPFIDVVAGVLCVLGFAAISAAEDKAADQKQAKEADWAMNADRAEEEPGDERRPHRYSQPALLRRAANDGFTMMQNEIETLRQAPAGKEPYEFKHTNGFLATFEMSSKDAKQPMGKESASAK